MLLGGITVAGVFISAHFNGSLLEKDIETLRSFNAQSDLSYYGGSSGFTLDSVLSAVVTFAFWAMVGMAAYFTVAGIVSVLRSTQQFEQELHYVHSQRWHIVRTAMARLSIRILVLGAWFFYARFFVTVIVPHCLLWLYIAAYSVTVSSISSAALAFIVITCALHVHLVLLRLLALRPRLFEDELYS